MYNFSGIYHRLIGQCGIMFLAGIAFFIMSRFWIKEKRNKKDVAMGCVAILVTLLFLADYLYAIKNPQIVVREASYLNEYRERRSMWTKEYTFVCENGEKFGVILDLKSKKEIYAPEFEKNSKYIVCYEERTKIIVRVEKVEDE